MSGTIIKAILLCQGIFLYIKQDKLVKTLKSGMAK
jgi:hypothetical protein